MQAPAASTRSTEIVGALPLAIDAPGAATVGVVESLLSPRAPGREAETKGLAALAAKSKVWSELHEIHGHAVEGPYPHGDRLAVKFNYDRMFDTKFASRMIGGGGGAGFYESSTVVDDSTVTIEK